MKLYDLTSIKTVALGDDFIMYTQIRISSNHGMRVMGRHALMLMSVRTIRMNAMMMPIVKILKDLMLALVWKVTLETEKKSAIKSCTVSFLMHVMSTQTARKAI